DFLKILKNEFDVNEPLHISSGNNFPSDCGLASSASSFAALTKGVYEYARSQNLTKERTLEELSQISQRGSGSSCRSFFSPFALWESEGARPVDLGMPGLLHAALIFENQKKEVSSSKAHVQVLTSDLFQGRVERAEKRLENLILAFQTEDWSKAFE
ncbi:MAG TPA: diphosphomevalonate decarboxylase, partial [Bdellovibrionales bacterium]|nr:diphosphomevalonate decarboxylase [Bdellovibrionales bacterium]